MRTDGLIGCCALLLAGCATSPSAQPPKEAVSSVEVAGYVVDGLTEAVLPGVQVILKTHEGLDVHGGTFTHTDSVGRYAFENVQPGRYMVQVWRGYVHEDDSVGQRVLAMDVNAQAASQMVNFRLQPDSSAIYLSWVRAWQAKWGRGATVPEPLVIGMKRSLLYRPSASDHRGVRRNITHGMERLMPWTEPPRPGQ